MIQTSDRRHPGTSICRRPRFLILAWLHCLYLLAGCATQTVEQPAPPKGEHLIGQPPADWVRVGAANLAGIRTAQYVAPGEAAHSWTRRITFEALVEQPLPDPLEFLELIYSEQRAACAGFESFPTFAGLENGYPTAVSLLVCARNHDSRLPQITMIKVIQGNEQFYVITRTGRGEAYVSPDADPVPRRAPASRPGEDASSDASAAAAAALEGAVAETAAVETAVAESTAAEQAVAAWSVYLKSVSLCDPGRAEHPCPGGTGAPLSAVD